jgi:hypothetical protein
MLVSRLSVLNKRKRGIQAKKRNEESERLDGNGNLSNTLGLCKEPGVEKRKTNETSASIKN